MASAAGTRPGKAAVALRLAGATYSEVSEVLGFADANQARAAVELELGRTADEPKGKATLREEASARLERLLRGVWQKAINPNDPEHLPSVRTAMSHIDRHIRLHGLDAPTEVLVHNPTTAEIEAWVAKMLSKQQEIIDVEEVDILALESSDA